jgi:cis-3-alkyl-4-acyloxetan-2-one decarboxylase
MRRLPAPKLPEWLAEMVPFERYIVSLGDAEVHVMEQGTGRPVLMLHGNPTWGFLYRKVAQALAGEPLRLVMPDLVGLGFSSRPSASEHTLERHIEWMGRLVDGLGLEGLVFVGQDWGGPIGLGLLADRPGLAAGLVLLNTVVGPPRPGFRPTTFHRLANLPVVSDALFRGLGFPQRALALAQGDRGSIRGRVTKAYCYPLRGWRRNAAPLAMARMVPSSHEHPSIAPLERSQAFVEDFEGPVALVWGDRDPVLGRVRSWIERLVPRARVTRTEAGHFLQEEVPREIAAAVRDVAQRAAPVGVPAYR